MPDRVQCDLCGTYLRVAASYVVHIDVFADPSLPNLTSEDMAEMDFDHAFAELVEQMKTMTADDLQDGVHRRFEYRLCPGCQRGFLANPLGKPRRVRAGKN